LDLILAARDRDGRAACLAPCPPGLAWTAGPPPLLPQTGRPAVPIPPSTMNLRCVCLGSGAGGGWPMSGS